MAYRRKHMNAAASNLVSDPVSPIPPTDDASPSSLAAQAIRASSMHRASSISTAYGESAYRESPICQPYSQTMPEHKHEYTSMKSLNEAKYSFWSVFTRKAKSVLEDESTVQPYEAPNKMSPQKIETSSVDQRHERYRSPQSGQKDNTKVQKGFGSIASSLTYIGDTLGNALEEGLTIVENKTADFISETRKLRKKGSNTDAHNGATKSANFQQPIQMQTDHDTQLKASRDVAMAMAAKAKLLLRELKTVKADLAFAKERCAQLEDENKILRESYEKGDGPEEDDLVRLQLETLLTEKARLAHENSLFARENRFLREIVEYHQLRMQDVVYLDEVIEEVKEVNPIPMAMSMAETVPSPASPQPSTDTYSASSISKSPIPMALTDLTFTSCTTSQDVSSSTRQR